MKWKFWLLNATFVLSIVCLSVGRAAAQYGAEVVSYDQGSTPAQVFNPDPSAPPEFFNNASAALDSPALTTSFGVVSPFNPPFATTDIVSVGEGGWLTLRLSNFVIPQPGGPEIGVFTNAGLADASFPSGQAMDPAFAFGADRAEVEVSEDGNIWESLGNTLFNLPTNAFTDLTDPFSAVDGNVVADFQQPFIGSLSDFDDLFYHDAGGNGILDELDGSGGGTWLDISGTSLSQVGYIRFSVADDGDAMTGLNFELDAVSIATGAVGAAVPEPASLSLLGLAAFIGLLNRKR